MKDWAFLTGDINWEDYGGTWFRNLRDGVYILLRFENMDEACGRDNEGYDTYLCDVLQVDLNTLPETELQSALQCCGIDLDEIEEQHQEIAKVDACLCYGAYAPLDSTSGNSYPMRVRAEARRIADTYFVDRVALEERLDRPVNMIGSTAREFGQGDLQSAMDRIRTPPDPGPMVKQIKQNDLSSECWLVQMRGVDACKGCEAYQTPECGGQEILKTGKNDKGILIGKGGL
jgi:hypothetical protein